MIEQEQFTGRQAAAFIVLVDLLEGVLVKGQKWRCNPKAHDIDPKTKEAAWVVHERQLMLRWVNAERSKMKKPDITIERLVEAERQAVGHSDYTRKFALYCAELVYDRF